MAATGIKMTAEEFLKLPENSKSRALIKGELHEWPAENPEDMTVRNRFHSGIMAEVTYHLRLWLEGQPQPRGKVYCGEVGVYLTDDAETAVGVDVAYVGAEMRAAQTNETTLIQGAPVLAVEIASPNDTVEETFDKIDGYLAAGVGLVWQINDRNRTVGVYRRDEDPVFFTARQELTAEPHLPGFRLPVARLFE